MTQMFNHEAAQAGYANGRTDGFHLGKLQGLKDSANDRAHKLSAEPSLVTGEYRVLVIAPGIIPTLEIGILQPFNQMKTEGGFDYELRLEGDVSRELIAQFDTVVFMRNVEPAAYQYLAWAKELRKKTVYMVDDHFLAIEPTTPVGAYYANAARAKTFIQFLKQCDIIKVDSALFADYIRKHYNPNVQYFPGSVDFDWLQQASKPERDDGQIVIGYEGGVKEDDFADVVPALRKILDYYGSFVRLEFVGFVPARLRDHPNVTVLSGHPDYRTFMHQMFASTWDIGIAPLRPSRFNNYKTNNKFREYAACWIPGIYSNMPVYNTWVKHGETGYLVPHTEEGWHEGLIDMIEHPELRHRVREQAWEFSRQQFDVSLCVECWRTFIFQEERRLEVVG